MSNYNNISRSRSRERYNDDYYERNKYDNEKNEIGKIEYRGKALNFDRQLENLRDKIIRREKEREIERKNFLRRENDLLKEINMLKHQNYLYEQETPKKFYSKRNQYQKDGQQYNLRQLGFSEVSIIYFK